MNKLHYTIEPLVGALLVSLVWFVNVFVNETMCKIAVIKLIHSFVLWFNCVHFHEKG